MAHNSVLFFDSIDKQQLPLVGGKGANLGEMTAAGFPIPDGFCVTTIAYQAFIEYNRLENFITRIIAGASPETVSQVGPTLRRRLQQATMPEALAGDIVRALDKAGAENAYAVRSSATAEDLAFASFAGQQDTYLNIRGAEAVLKAVKDCWASLFTDRAILYRTQNHIAHEQVAMSVVVQKMITPEISGVMFTADPVSGHRGLITMEAIYGLGEALVSGLASPDLYTVSKQDRQIIRKTISEQKLAIQPTEGGGTHRIEVTGETSTRQVMGDSDIKRLAEMGLAIEQHYGCPQDIEWCLDDRGDLYIVQSRAITSLFPLPSPQPQDGALHVYVSLGHIQNMTEPISRMGIDVMRMILRVDRNGRSEAENKTFTSAAGRLYVDLSKALKIQRTRTRVASVLSNMDALLASSLTILMERPEFEARLKKIEGSLWPLAPILLPALLKVMGNLLFMKPEGAVARMNQFVDEHEKTLREALSRAKSGINRLDIIYASSNLVPVFVERVFPMLGTGVIGFRLLGQLERRFLGTDVHTNTLAQGLEGNITTEAGLLLGDLADQIRKSPVLLAEFESEDHGTLIPRINSLGGQDDFKRAFNAFLEKHGSRAAGEIDIAKDRWSENPDLLVRSVMAMVHTAQAGAHRKEYAVTIEKAEIAAAELVREVEGRHGKLKGLVVTRLVKIVRNVLPIREHHKYLFVRLLFMIKNALQKEAVVLVEKGQLAETKDIFYVGFWELYRAIQNNGSLKDLVKRRKEEYLHFSKLSAPRVLTSEGEVIRADYNRKDLPAGALPGMAASAGVVEGLAKVIVDPAKESVNKGEILIAPFTDPGWTPLFLNAAGLVMEIGGLLTHGTVVAREYGIPAVVGVDDATHKIKTGQRIRVDGHSGFVLILEG